MKRSRSTHTGGYDIIFEAKGRIWWIL